MRRKTIGILLDFMTFFGGGYEEQLRLSLDTQCKKLGYDLALIFGGALDADQPWIRVQNGLFHLAHPDRLDGLIVASSLLAAACGTEGVKPFIESLSSMPICSLGLAIDGVPSVVVDNRAGMRAVVEHLIDVHGFRRLAFLSGTPSSPEAQVRLDVCREVLRERDLPFDPRLEKSGYFVMMAGHDAMLALLDCGEPIDAVVAANDSMAFGALTALHERGRNVPEDVCVTGFDDLRLARLADPALTTVAQPFEAMVSRVLELLDEQGRGRSVPALTEIPTKMVVRKSCGCGMRRLPVAAQHHAPVTPGNALDYLRQHREAVCRAVAGELQMGALDGERAADALTQALERELAGTPGAFMRATMELHDGSFGDAEQHRGLQNGVARLRDELQGVANRELESVFFDTMSRLARANATVHVGHQMKLDMAYLKLLASAEGIGVVLDHAALRSALEVSLPAAGLPTVVISRFSDGQDTLLEPYAAVVDGKPKELPREPFPAHLLYPDGAFPSEQRRTLAIFALAYETRFVGVVAFEYHEGVLGHPVARGQISAALRTIDLHQELVNRTMLQEHKRLESLSVLAGGIAHDLNNALGPLVALPDVILSDLASRGLRRDDLGEALADIQTIKLATLRASQSIRDLLTLGRTGRTHVEPLDVSRVVENALDDASCRSIVELNPLASVQVQLSQERLVIRGAEAQLARAIVNLTRNAVEAVTGAGSVRIRVYPEHVEAPLDRHETIAPGRYAVIEVVDSGNGIAPDDIGRLFDPFFSKKPTRTQSGTGLGLAVVRSVVKEHGGYVHVESTVGEGTKFQIYLPRVDDSLRPDRRSSIPLRQGVARILIIDDDPVQRRTGRRVLGQLGYEVDVMRSGVSAIESFAAAASSGVSPYDLVLLDMILNEERDGLEVFEVIEQMFPHQRAIVVSGHAPNDRVEQAVARGLGWLAKPYTSEALVRAVNVALQDR